MGHTSSMNKPTFAFYLIYAIHCAKGCMWVPSFKALIFSSTDEETEAPNNSGIYPELQS